ncbi:restriction endonuclease subunit S [Blautia hydrogenotrophica]|uniref:restriction endonuclease subunit S n=1 Tax=Blautia hydrogenotrophica TaxID=53443 RepID=UPI002E77E1D2|nr:restriction endonuclease subunit S [Blautia hydrogenotrophica]MEE0463670.1 restriction endonuclease subunit S [Blautia hydrogenotrophica]
MKRLTLGDVCKKASSNIAQKDLQDKMGVYPIYGASGLIKQVDFYQQDKEYIAVVKDGAGIGRTMLLPAYSSVIGTMQYLLPKEGIPIDIKYLFYAVEHMNLAKYFSGATIPHIYFKDYQKEPINIPDIDTQKRISRIFDKIDALISSRKEQRTKLDQIVKSRFIEMFGDPKSNPNSYPISQLSEHIEFLTSGSRGWAQYCVDNGSEWFITIKNVKDCRISIDNMQPINAPDNAEAKRTKVQEGDLLISITADLGRTGVVTKEIADHGAYINQHLTCIRLNKEMLNPLYVAFFMESPAGKEQFESKNQSAVKAGLNFNSINSLRLLVPPMDEQNAFVGFVHQIDKSKLAIQKSLEKLEILKKSLMQKYFG